MLAAVNRTLTDLQSQLGTPARFQIDAEPSHRKCPVTTTVRWRCGCRAEGSGLRALHLSPCAQHAPAPEPARLGFRVPFIGALLGRAGAARTSDSGCGR